MTDATRRVRALKCHDGRWDITDTGIVRYLKTGLADRPAALAWCLEYGYTLVDEVGMESADEWGRRAVTMVASRLGHDLGDIPIDNLIANVAAQCAGPVNELSKLHNMVCDAADLLWPREFSDKCQRSIRDCRHCPSCGRGSDDPILRAGGHKDDCKLAAILKYADDARGAT